MSTVQHTDNVFFSPKSPQSLAGFQHILTFWRPKSLWACIPWYSVRREKPSDYAVIHFYIPTEDSNRWTDISSPRIMSNWQVSKGKILNFLDLVLFFLIIPWCVINPTYWVLHVVQQIVSFDSDDMTAKAAMHSKEASGENIFCGFSQAEFVSQVWVWQRSGCVCWELLLGIMLQPLRL